MPRTIDGKDLKELLEELYRFYFKTAKDMLDKGGKLTELESYYGARSMGAEEAIGAVYLALYGGKDMTKLYSECVSRTGENDKKTGD